jgi:prepilin-type N-terminal cleavage/methylation domain-containing protein
MQLKNTRKGFTLVEIMIVVAIIGLLAAIAIPNFIKARQSSQTNACINNLRQIEGAKATWALETKQTGSATPVETDLYGSTLYIRDTPLCPGSGSYTINAINTKAACSKSTAPDFHTLP